MKKGLEALSTTRPTLRLRPARSWLAAALRTKPSFSIAVLTRSRVAAETRSGWLSTLDTVPTETPASRATSLTPTFITGFSFSAGRSPHVTPSH